MKKKTNKENSKMDKNPMLAKKKWQMKRWNMVKSQPKRKNNNIIDNPCV